ncbi:MAG: NAD(P)-binding protein [Rhodospirillaceae bacterium]|jgi:6-hydroxynicotinate 3-monooxygenase|nr:NAD(P)-binding protein [Rhodospirillaceae bacterium]MBT4488809.1 NAD(P)-binding protein [Rhodospirillaceae bacterium]MBT5192428.1 NAD(P)-binding protein [Rhodospirillaceae bacterium]MBT5897798.1 NAD(P)-binding protein [Rhodospirillaceae bacterium]MBT6426468.1 NAD(P)-binding protein [Rhodospirillaceae bacterium]
MDRNPRIAIIGAGMGGLAAAAALRGVGFQVHVYEQAEQFARVGAGIQMSPNAMRALRGLGLEETIRRTAFQPETWNNREWDSGAEKFELTLGRRAEAQFGAPYLQMHRGDLHAALLSAVPATDISLNKRLVDVAPLPNGCGLSFADGTEGEADLIVGADGVHSRIREILHGAERPTATGRVAYRATFPASRLRQPVGECTKWWGPDRHIVIYYVTAARDEVYFVTSLPDPDWAHESWSATGDMAVVRDAFAGFHDEVREVLRACETVHRWAILDREPLENWFGNGSVLLGDAAHPMTPYMAQGAAMAIEDGVMLARALQQSADINGALEVFEATRKARTAQVQAVSHANTWMRQETDPTWCYGYDPWTEPLSATGVQ